MRSEKEIEIMKLIKFLKCCVVGHKFDTPSIINTICSENWLKKCSCCGCYAIHGEIGSVILTERQAFKVKKEFEEDFPYSKDMRKMV